MDADNPTLKDLKQLLGLFSGHNTDGPYRVGDCKLFRLVTHFWTGRIVAIYPDEIVLGEAAWIADMGRFADALKSGELSEIEPSERTVIIGRHAIIDACDWLHQLPRSQK